MPTERFEWLEIPREPVSSLPEDTAGEATPTRLCPECGWLEAADAPECFRCGYRFEPALAAVDFFHAEGIQLPEPRFDVRKDAQEVFRSHRRAPWPIFSLRTRVESLRLVRGFDTLLTLDQLPIEKLKHQIDAARTALSVMRGQALLADEVGLGKTIEACIVLKELIARGLVRKALILTPASLTAQWQDELRVKFGESFALARKPADFDLPRVISSTDRFRAPTGAERVLSQRWDMLIVDEAHHLKNQNSRLYRLVSRIRKKYVLFLTATPFHNTLRELYNLVNILKPGLLGTVRSFNRQFVRRNDPVTPVNAADLRALLGRVMVRNRRALISLSLPERRAGIYHMVLTPDEQSLYDDVTDYVRRGLRGSEGNRGRILSLITVQKEICSSPHAAGRALLRLSRRPDCPQAMREALSGFAARCRAVRMPRKTLAVLEILQRFPGRMIVYTEFLATLRHLAETIRAAGRPVLLFHGGLLPRGRAQAARAFAETPDAVLVCTQAAGEGLNLQCAHQILNYDLPWNPMRVEQRIGRVHRIGQTRDVNVFNLSVEGTIEARILEVLAYKIRLFELVIGELDLVLGSMEKRKSFEEMVTELWVKSRDDEDFARRMGQFGDELARARDELDTIHRSGRILSSLSKPVDHGPAEPDRP